MRLPFVRYDLKSGGLRGRERRDRLTGIIKTLYSEYLSSGTVMKYHQPRGAVRSSI